MTAPLPSVFAQGQGAVSADNLNTFVQTVTNYAQMRTFTGLSNMVVFAQGASAADDGGQGNFYFNSTIVNPTDNNSTVIVPTGSIQGAWLAMPISTVGNLTVTGTLTVDGATTMIGAVTVDSTLTVDGPAIFQSDISCLGTGELGLPAGTTAQRTSSPTLGDIRYNTSLGLFEGYGASGWQPLAGSVTSGIFPGDISGLLPSSIAGSSTSAALSVSSGKAVDSTAATIMSTTGATAWAASNGNAINGYQGGTTLPNSSTIHFFICQGGSGTGVFASISLTPTLPTGYTSFFRRIFSLVTTSGGAPIPFTADEVSGGGLCAYLTTQTLDISAATVTTANRTLYSMNVPSGVKMQWMGRVAPNVQTFQSLIVTSPDETDVAASSSGAPLFDVQVNTAGNSVLASFQTGATITNTGGQIGVRGAAALAINGVTRGWVDFRRT